jgi:hypothetical protein
VGKETEDGSGDSESDQDTRDVMVVGLVSDPDLPESIARRVADDLPGILDKRVSDHVRWRVDTAADPFEAAAPNFERLIDKARERVRETNWDFAICVTDVPVRGDHGFVVADISAKDDVAMISLPALGGIRLRQRTREMITSIVDFLAVGVSRPDGARPPSRPEFDRGLLGIGPTSRVLAPDSGDVSIEVVRPVRRGLPRMLAGMVRANRPWQLVLGLSTALAGSLAGAAFGLLYSSIWQLATALSPPRLIGITLAAIIALVSWIIVGHNLWERRSMPGGKRPSGTALRNAGTVLTVGFGALAFFLTLFILAAASAAVIIPPDYLTKTIGRPADWTEYLTVALMSSVLGTVAGAVGSGLEDDSTVRKATYGFREQERWREVTRAQPDDRGRSHGTET